MNLRSSPRWLSAAAGCALILFVFLTVFDVIFVPVEKDEGIYAYAFRLVSEGKVPYRDFTYIESPGLPYYYAALLAFPGIDLRNVRILCAVTGFVALCLLLACAARLGGKTAAALSALLLFTNARLAEWFSRDVTYPLVTLLLASSLLIALSRLPDRFRTAAQGALLALAGAVKASMGIVSLAWMGGMLLGHRRDRKAVLWGALAFGATLGLSVGPFLLADPGAFFFNVVEAAVSRGRLFPFMSRPDALDQWLEFGSGQKILAARTILLWNFPMVILAAVIVLAGTPRLRFGKDGPLPKIVPITAALAVGVLFHWLFPSPSYPNYQMMLLPVLTVPLAVAYAASAEKWGEGARRILLALPVVLGGLSLLEGANPDEAGLGVGTYRHGPQRELTQLVERTVSPGGWLLTDYLPVAVESHRRVVPGNEGGRASLVLGLDDRRAAALHVLNRNAFLAVLREGRAQGVVLTRQLFEDSFRAVPGFLEETEEALASRYELVKEFPESVYFAYGRTRVFRRRPG
jgi:hypothetical protein